VNIGYYAILLRNVVGKLFGTIVFFKEQKKETFFKGNIPPQQMVYNNV
jgi:hypothetical protein